MIHIATVHWRDPRWIAIQQERIRCNLSARHRIYANLEGIGGRQSGFYHCDTSGGDHPEKLNALAQSVLDREPPPDDLLIFMDGDAFPIRPLDDWLTTLLKDAPIAAVQRLENSGDIQPHPCFCVTTVGFWRELHGDWRPGGSWLNARGEAVTDVGGLLMEQLASANFKWNPIHRSNTFDLHPVLFGIYGRHVYHHGAGFRDPYLRVDGSEASAAYVRLKRQARLLALTKVRPRHAVLLRRAMTQRRALKAINGTVSELRAESDKLFAQIEHDPDFFRTLESSI